MEEEKLKITFDDKIALNEQTDIDEVNKVSAENINEIKGVVNNISNNIFYQEEGEWTLDEDYEESE